jgi:cephalosporin hydroxylase
VRVPAERLNEALERIRADAVSVDSENVAGQDVTQEYTDLSSQLTNLQAAEEQLQTIMDSARQTEDVLAVYNELVRVRGEIETIQGRIRYFDEAAAYSSITANLQPVVVTTLGSDEGWSPLTTASNAVDALVTVAQFAVDALITLAILGLPLLVLILLARFGLRRIRRRVVRPAA